MTIRLKYGDKEMSWGMPVSAINLHRTDSKAADTQTSQGRR